MKTKNALILIFLIVLGASLFFAWRAYTKHDALLKGRRVSLGARRQEWLKLKNVLEKKVAGFNGTVGVAIEDLDTGWQIALNKDIPIPSASLVKIPIMLTCFYAAQDKRIDLKDTVKIRGSDRVAGSKVLGSQPAGYTYDIEGLLGPMITESDNTAANILINTLGFDMLNMYFVKMGLKSTNISRKMMDFEERKEGVENYTTAQDMAYIMKKLYRRDFLNKGVSEKCLSILAHQKINDRIPRKIPKSGITIAHKTGLEKHICHDVGIVFTPHGDFIICVLIKHEGKFARPAKKLISEIALLTYNYYSLNN